MKLNIDVVNNFYKLKNIKFKLLSKNNKNKLTNDEEMSDSVKSSSSVKDSNESDKISKTNLKNIVE